MHSAGLSLALCGCAWGHGDCEWSRLADRSDSTRAEPRRRSRGELPVSVLLPFKVSNVVCGGGEGLVKGFWARAARWVTPSDVAAV